MRHVSEDLALWLNNFNQQLPILIGNGYRPTSTNAREGLANLTQELVTSSPTVARVQDDVVSGDTFDVPVRIYHPIPSQSLPVLVFFHGGGHMAGSVTVYDPIARKLATATQHIVVSVDYRLAPECRYPCGVDDAYTVVKGIWNTLDNNNIQYQKQLSIMGDSGGGALTATISEKAQRDEEVIITNQVLVYPSLDYTMDHYSYTENGSGYLLHTAKIKWYFDNYFNPDDDRREASPLYGEFTDKLPRTLLFTAEFCPLRDEGIEYCKKAEYGGAEVKHVHFEHMIHTFLNMEDVAQEACASVYGQVNAFINHKPTN
ncbi:alpha/beta hydrolase [Thaumasiovibrio subtropicus]|uniref:alpha/beta hydrolase n=1 Tax=Thaumasiovibrio subtropicus TaxID=1891207 RepID=UPI000B34DF27|nr:alpha/beta hydrolase [Thaumasiovibrio subtropicus]